MYFVVCTFVGRLCELAIVVVYKSHPSFCPLNSRLGEPNMLNIEV